MMFTSANRMMKLLHENTATSLVLPAINMYEQVDTTAQQADTLCDRQTNTVPC